MGHTDTGSLASDDDNVVSHSPPSTPHSDSSSTAEVREICDSASDELSVLPQCREEDSTNVALGVDLSRIVSVATAHVKTALHSEVLQLLQAIRVKKEKTGCHALEQHGDDDNDDKLGPANSNHSVSANSNHSVCSSSCVMPLENRRSLPSQVFRSARIITDTECEELPQTWQKFLYELLYELIDDKYAIAQPHQSDHNENVNTTGRLIEAIDRRLFLMARDEKLSQLLNPDSDLLRSLQTYTKKSPGLPTLPWWRHFLNKDEPQVVSASKGLFESADELGK